MFRTATVLIALTLLSTTTACANGDACLPSMDGTYTLSANHRQGAFWERILGSPASPNVMPQQRTTGLPTGRSYYGNRYFGNFNNRYFGPQYGYF